MYEEIKIQHINFNRFDVFSDHVFRKEREKLFREFWIILEENGLTTARNDIEFTEVYFRVFALVGLIGDFSTIVCDTPFSKNYIEWFEESELPEFHIAQMIGIRKEFVDYIEAESFNRDAINKLVSIERKSIVELLLNEFDGKRKLFLKLWSSTCNDDDLVEPTYEQLETEEIKNRVTTIIDAYEWVVNGCNEMLYFGSDTFPERAYELEANLLVVKRKPKNLLTYQALLQERIVGMCKGIPIDKLVIEAMDNLQLIPTSAVINTLEQLAQLLLENPTYDKIIRENFENPEGERLTEKEAKRILSNLTIWDLLIILNGLT